MHKNYQEIFSGTLSAADQMWRSHAQRSPRKQEKQQKRSVYHQCSFCGKRNEQNLRACAVCKAVRYCNKGCQVADYKARHRDDCKSFVQPPFTTAFMTEPVGNARYPTAPVFASGQKEGVGCWVSIHGGADVQLQFPLAPVLWDGGTEDAIRERILEKGDPADAKKYGSYKRSLLSLRVLVQNRRKDKAKALIFAAQTQVISCEEAVEVVMRGMTEGDRLFTFQSASGRYAAMVVPEDPWDKKPRLAVINFNGVDLTDPSKTPPAGVLNAERGIVALDTGEYAILQLQFRVGNGVNIRKDYEALFCLQGLSLPLLAPWSGESPEMVERSICELFDSSDRAPFGIHTFFSEEATQEYYQDVLEGGDRAFLESHHGKGRAAEWEGKSHLMLEQAKMMLQYAEECGDGPLGLSEILKQCEKAGVGNPARCLEIIRSGRLPEERSSWSQVGGSRGPGRL